MASYDLTSFKYDGDTYNLPGTGGGGSKNVWAGISTSAASEANRVVQTTSSDFQIANGNIIFVTFSYSFTGSGLTLNVDGTGALSAIASDGTGLAHKWAAGEIVGFKCNGSQFVMLEDGTATTTVYGQTKLSSSTSSTSEIVAATPKAVKQAYDLADGKSTVTWTQSQATGTKIAEISIDGTSTDVYAPSGGSGSEKVWYGICSDTGNQRTATTSSGDFVLEAGNVAYIRMDNVLTFSTFAINIDGTGQKGVALSTDGYGEGRVPAYFWESYEVVCLVYDGTRFLIPQGSTLKELRTKSTVSWSQSQTTGTKIATVTIDGSPTDVYAPSGGGGGGSYSATAPISISNDTISHDTSGVTAGTYDGGWVKGTGFYLPSFTVDANGHVTAASDLGQAIPVITSGVNTESAFLMYGYQYNDLPRMTSNYGNAYLLSAGNTTATFTLSDSTSISPYYMRVVGVEAVDATTGEKVLVDWTTNYPISTAGKTNSITLSVSIANAYTHNIVIIPMVSYATAGM